MAQTKIEKEIAELQKVIDDPKTPADVKKTLTVALANAKKHVGDAAGEKKKSVKKITSTHKGEKALDDCREIIKKYQSAKKTEVKRVEKRVAAGKPEKLTPAETIGKAARSVKKKVEEMSPTKKDFEQSLSKIVDMVKAIQAGLATDSERFAFAHRLIEELKELRYPKKAAKGMHVEDGKGEAWHPDAQIDVHGYKTENFTYDAKDYFEELIGDGSVATHAKADLVSMARDFDEVLGVYRKEVEDGDGIYKGDYIAAIRYLMRGMYYAYPAITHASSEIYPAFITTYMYRIARKLKTDLTADAGLHVATGEKYAEGGEVEEINIYTDDAEKAEDIKAWLNLAKENKFVYDIKVSDEAGKKAYALVRKRKMADGGEVEGDRAELGKIYKEVVGYDVVEDDPEITIPGIFELTEGHDAEMKGEKYPKGSRFSDSKRYRELLKKYKDKKMFGGQVNVAAPDNLAAKDNGGEQFLSPSFAKGGKVEGSIYTVRSIKDLHWHLNAGLNSDAPPYFSCKVDLEKDKLFKGGLFLVTFQTTDDGEIEPETVRAIDLRRSDRGLGSAQVAYAMNRYFIEHLGEDYKLSLFTELKKGGRITFKEKAKDIARSLVGKKVPPKYKKDYGKRYGKVTSAIAARRIAGSIVEKEKEKKEKEKKAKKKKVDKKMFGGLVNVAATDNLAAKDNGGEQFLSPSV